MFDARPFVPFRADTSDGKHLDIRHRDLALLSRLTLNVDEGVEGPTREIPPRTQPVSPLQVAGLEPAAR